MLDLERLNASVSAKEEGDGEKKKGLTKNAKPKKKKNVEFWNEFVYLMKIAFPSCKSRGA